MGTCEPYRIFTPLVSSRPTNIRAVLTYSTARITNERGGHTTRYEEGAIPAGHPLLVIYSVENRTRGSVLAPPRPRPFRPVRRSSSDGKTSPASRPEPSSACQPRSRSCAPPCRSHGRKRHRGTEVRPNGNTGQTTDAKRIDRTRHNLTSNGVIDRSRSPSNAGIPCYQYSADRYINFTRLELD